MLNIKDRYSIAPQMKDYDNLSCVYRPYVMFFNKENYKSQYVNTNNYGFRINYFNNKTFSNEEIISKKKEISIILGGSLAFGFGSTSDKNTISSNMSNNTRDLFLNFGATAFNSKQEFILFLNYIEKFYKIKRLIIISGINDFYLSLIKNEDIWGNIFFEDKFKNALIKKRKNYLDFFNFKNKSNNINYDNLKIDLLDRKYMELFSLWKKLSIVYKFKITYVLQPFCQWFKSNLCTEEINLFNILDNSNDQAHQILKIISNNKFYINFKSLLEENCNLNNLNFIDLNKELKDLNTNKDWLFVDRVHMTDHGYNEISNILIDKIS